MTARTRKTAAAPAKRTRAPRKTATAAADIPTPVEQAAADPPPIDRYREQEIDPPPLVDARWDGYEEPDYCDHYGEPLDRTPSPRGCLVPVMFAAMMLVIVVLFAVLLSERIGGSDRTPDAPTPTVTPASPELTALTYPIRAKLASDRAKAAIVADAYTGLVAALRGKSGERIADSRTFETASRAYLADVDARGGVPVGKEIDEAIGGYLGMSRSADPKDPGWNPITFDASHRAKLIEVVAAIAKTAEELR